MSLATFVYLTCAVLSAACSYMLLRGYQRGRDRLLLWSGLCFVGLALNNMLLVVDLTILPRTDLSVLRTIPAAAGVAALVFGLVWEAR